MGVMCTALLNAIRQISERLWKFFCLLPPAADIRRVNLRNAASGCASLRFRDSRAAGFGYPGGYVGIRPNAARRCPLCSPYVSPGAARKNVLDHAACVRCVAARWLRSWVNAADRWLPGGEALLRASSAPSAVIRRRWSARHPPSSNNVRSDKICKQPETRHCFP